VDGVVLMGTTSKERKGGGLPKEEEGDRRRKLARIKEKVKGGVLTRRVK